MGQIEQNNIDIFLNVINFYFIYLYHTLIAFNILSLH